VVVNDDEIGYRDALAAVLRAGQAFSGGLSNAGVMSMRHAGGVTPWVPIYRDLLADLRAGLRAAGDRYELAAAAAGVAAAERFDWRGLLAGDSEAAADPDAP
jgi:hypothetical protein